MTRKKQEPATDIAYQHGYFDGHGDGERRATTDYLNKPPRDRRDAALEMSRERDQLRDRIRRIMADGNITDPLAELVALLQKRLDKLTRDIAELRRQP